MSRYLLVTTLIIAHLRQHVVFAAGKAGNIYSDKCDPSFCQSGGTCTDDSYGVRSCICPPGTAGRRCEYNRRTISTCDSDGTLNKTLQNGKEACICKKGYYGMHCERYQCEPLRCKSGDCEIRKPYTGEPKCICWPGVKGSDCSECDSNYCKNGGTCHYGGTYWTVRCLCPAGFSGDRCENRTCSLKCLNGGTCLGDAVNQTCSCPPGFSGKLCEKNLCLPSPCVNNGTCTAHPTGFKCDCSTDFEGERCEISKFCSHCERKGIRASAVAGTSCTSYRVEGDIFKCPRGLTFDPNFCGCIIIPIATMCTC